MENILRAPQILLPGARFSLEKWAVVACDQFTSQPEYWQETQALAQGAPSALNIVYPEAWLAQGDARIAEINRTMEEYLHGVLTRQVDGYVLVERETSTGKRLGLVAEIDLAAYDYRPGSAPRIRATEGTILERIPPRVKIRENAPLETPHAMLLADDPGRTLIEPLYARRDSFELLYDFDLMQGGGHIRGWRVDGAQNAQIEEAARALEKEGLAFAVGDGNHSLAAARRCWELSGEPLARWALVEIVNVYDEALVFEPIHRAVFGVDEKKLLEALKAQCGAPDGQRVVVCKGKEKTELYFSQASSNLPVGTLQKFLDAYIEENGGRIDYIHGEEVVEELSAQEGNIGFLLEAMPKKELFKTVVLDGALPRKTFSMGHAWDKRFYMECRQIQE